MENKAQIEKRVKMTLVGLDGNAFVLMGTFSANAKKQGWSKAEINEVLEECRSGDYDNLLSTLIKYTTEED